MDADQKIEICFNYSPADGDEVIICIGRTGIKIAAEKKMFSSKYHAPTPVYSILLKDIKEGISTLETLIKCEDV